MNCPSCNTRVSEGAFICSHCDHILDTSFLGGDITNEEAPPQKRKAPPTPAAEPEPPAASAPTDGRLARLDVLAAPTDGTSQALEELVADFKAMSLGRRLTVAGAGGVLLSLALPWQATARGDSTIGLLAGGGFIGLLAALVVFVVFSRRHPWLAPHRLPILVGTVATSGLVTLLCVRSMRTALEYRMVIRDGFRLRENTAWPSIGLYICLVAAFVMLAGSVKSWLERNRPND